MKADVELGFKLAGVETRISESSEDCRKFLEKSIQEKEYSLVFIDESLTMGREFDEPFLKRLDESNRPLFLIVPLNREYSAKEMATQVIGKMVRRAIGYEIRLE